MIPWQPFQEPIRRTLYRNVMIALVMGGVAALASRRWSIWPPATLLALWPSLGGHWVEVWFLNWLRPRLSPAPGVQIGARVLTWFVGGSLLAVGMRLTASAVAHWRWPPWISWWVPGVAFIVLELIVHLVMQLGGQANFYNRRA